MPSSCLYVCEIRHAFHAEAHPRRGSAPRLAGRQAFALLVSRAMAGDTISFARGAPSADILPHEAVRDAAARALAEDWEKALSYGTGIGHPGLCEWIAERHGGLDAGQVMVANGSLEAGAMLFEHLLEPGDRVSSSSRPTTARCCCCSGSGSSWCRCRWRPTGSTSARFEAALADGPDQARPRHPQLPQPGRLHALGREAGAAGRARRRARLLDLRGRPLPRAALRGRGAGDDALDRQGRPRRPRLLLLEDGQPRRPGRLPGRARRRRSRSSPSAPTRPTSRRTCWPSRSSSSSAARAGSTATSSSSKARCASAATRWSRRSREQIPEAEFVVPGGGYFLWLDLAEGTDTTALLAEAKGEGVAFVAGPDFMIEGGEQQPPPLLRQRARRSGSPRASPASPARSTAIRAGSPA